MMMNRVKVTLAVILAVGTAAYAQSVPQLVNYQGILRQVDGSPYPDGTYDISFRIYDDPAEGVLIWGETYQVMVVGGQFNVILGAHRGTPVGGAAANDIAYAFTESDRYLGITVGTGTEILPRQQILSAPFALQAAAATHGVPPGTILPFGGVGELDSPVGYIPCDGRPVGREQYAGLFAAIGTAWGAGDGSTTFNVPDLRGYFLRGTDAGAGRDPDAADRTTIGTGGNTGDNVGSIQPDQFGEHTHTGLGKHLHFWRGYFYAESGNDQFCRTNSPDERQTGFKKINRPEDGFDPDDPACKDSNHDHGPQGGNETHPKNAYVNYIIKY